MAENAPNLRAEHLYAVVRFDVPARGALGSVVEYPGNYITVKEILPTQEEADREVERLTALNDGKGCIYFSSITRFYPEGRGLDSD